MNEGHDRANIIFNLGVNYLWVIYHQRFPILGEAPQINRGVGYEGEPAEKNFPWLLKQLLNFQALLDRDNSLLKNALIFCQYLKMSKEF